MTGKSIKLLSNFPSERTADRRLKLLVDNKLLKREKLIYGIPYLYTLAHKGRKTVNVNKRAENIRLDTIRHNLIVLDTIHFITLNYNITLDEIVTEKELHRKDGFGIRHHRPDFIFTHNNKSCAVEVELSLKPKELLIKNIKQNYIEYDYQVWFINKDNKKLFQNINENKHVYDNIIINYIEVFYNE